MSASRSPERSPAPGGDRRMSGSSNRRPSMDVDEAPVKRARIDSRSEDKARGKRLFGNILGTLQKFKKEDKTNRSSEAAKRREQLSERISSKIRSETNLQHEIQEAERELKTLRISTDSLEVNLRHKEVSMKARHTSMKPISRFLHTSLPPAATPVHDTHLLNPAPIPLNQGPTKEAPHPNQLKPLYFLPRILIPAQQSELDSRIANIDELITDEEIAFHKEKEAGAGTIKKNRARIEELSAKLVELRKQVKPLEIRGRATTEQTDEMGRQRRSRDQDDEMQVEQAGGVEQDSDMHVEKGKEQGKETDKEKEKEDEKEAGVQISNENGDIEVEY